MTDDERPAEEHALERAHPALYRRALDLMTAAYVADISHGPPVIALDADVALAVVGDIYHLWCEVLAARSDPRISA